ncbi:hypothetical protein BAE44_0021844 [Dichanthelium oligosanthes]|uniref:DUF642 domain-containing protein n=1 Tax=Dichanthelium oligosanthes TaxID=888268 RepID=A0A1E5UW61_9POAL|nr:hypothetical protein BAE44_0021844 [Dichanthelium oligosanthes]
MLPNGNFEEAPPKSQLNGTRVMGRYAIPHWEISGFVEYIGSGQKQGDMLLPVPEGAYAVRLGNEASITQRIAVTRGAHYSITFSAARTCAQAEQLNVTVAPESDTLPIQTVYTSSGWDSYSWAFKATSSVVSLIVHNPGVAEDPACGPLLDVFAIKTLLPPQSSKNNFLKNGDFEEGPYMFSNTAWGVLVPPMDEDDYSPLSPWMVMSTTKSVKYVDAAHYAVPHGARAVELVSGMETALVQDVAGTVPGLPYKLEFSVGDGRDGCVGSMAVEASAGRGSVRVPYQSQGKGGYKRGALEFTAIANETRVVFVSMAYNTKPDGTLCGPVVDDVSLKQKQKQKLTQAQASRAIPSDHRSRHFTSTSPLYLESGNRALHWSLEHTTECSEYFFSRTRRLMRREREMAHKARHTRFFLLVCLVSARPATAIPDGLLPNGNFEEAPDRSQLNGTRVTGRYAIPHWEVSGLVEYIGSGQKQGDMLLPVPEGACAVRLGNEASIRQRLTNLARRTYYSITFSAARTCAQAEQLNVTVEPESDLLPIQTVYTSNGWDSYSWAFKARHTAVTLIVHNPGVTDDAACGPLLDSFAIKTAQPPQCAKNNMLKNGDFEEGPYIFPGTPWGVLVPPLDEDDYSPLSPWMILSPTKSVKYLDAAHYAVPHGAHAVELVSGMETALAQDVATVAGRRYRLEFSAGDAGDGCVGSLAVQAYAARGSVRVPYESQGKGGSRRGGLDFAAIANVTRVVFVSMAYTMKSDGTLCGPVVDDASLPRSEAAKKGQPEPGSLRLIDLKPEGCLRCSPARCSAPRAPRLSGPRYKWSRATALLRHTVPSIDQVKGRTGGGAR